jgi:N-formylmaleamate deformylase
MLPHWTESDVDVNGIHVHYLRTGDGSKPPLVLTHGFSDNGLCWLPVARDLEADYDVILPDARGHGKSARFYPDEAVDAPADLAGLIRLLGLRQPVVGGHSMGASVSALTAMRYPTLVRALVLEDPAWRAPEPDQGQELSEQLLDPFDEWLLSLDGKDIDEIVAKCRADSPSWAEVELLPWAVSKQQLDKTIFQTRDAAYLDWQEVVPGIRCPTLLIVADVEKGAIVPQSVATRVQALNPCMQVVKVAGAGHNIRRENYPDYMMAVRAFLKSL